VLHLITKACSIAGLTSIEAPNNAD
jgi:hypothetical protein